ncbi:MAG: four helix bundle protein [Patescibacteria group bacterium]|nr:four helix bundle protein [Patescibacteria group bacterium]
MREGSYQDIDQRTFNFANRVIKMVPQLPNNVATWKIGAQVIDSATSVNSNIVQARGGLSKKDFTHHLRISLKEARETKRWLEMIVAVGLTDIQRMQPLLNENEEIICILVTMIINSQDEDLNKK